MFWEPQPPDFPLLPDAEIPTELLSALERLSEDGHLLQSRLRWRPHDTRASGYLTKARLMELAETSIVEIARVLASHARHLYEQHHCESRFEAQIQREIDHPEQPGATKREWRSITFYVKTPTTKVAEPMDDEFEDESDDDEGEDTPDEPERPSFHSVRAPPRRISVLPKARSASRASRFSEYAEYADMMREDPPLFAMVVVQESHDRIVATMERMLNSSSDRLDRVLDAQQANSRSVNEGMQMVTRGAGEIAGVGIDLFRSGLDHQAGVAKLQHDTEVDKDRSEVMRDAVNQGSQLVQAVIMSNTVKRRSSTEARPERPPRPERPLRTERPPRPEPQAEPESTPDHGADERLEATAREVMSQLTPQLSKELRQRVPKVADAVDSLNEGPITARRVREIIRVTTREVGAGEMLGLLGILGPKLTELVSDMILQVNNKGAA